MAIRRRRPAAKATASPTSRVHAMETLEQWESMLAKAAAAKRVVMLQLYQAQNYTCAQMRAYYRRMSVDPGLKAAVFAEVEVDSAEGKVLEACGMRDGAAKIPCYRCYVAGEEVENYAGGVPVEVAQMLSRQLAELKGSGNGLLAKLLLAAGAAAAVAAAAYWHLTRRGGGSFDIGAEMKSLSDRINVAQQRLRKADRAGRLKVAKNQRRILQQLQLEQSRLQQQLAGRQLASGGSQRAAAAEADSDAEEAAAERPVHQRRRRVAAAVCSSDDEDQQHGPAVLYSDEE